MELPLPGEAQGWPGVVGINRRTLDHLNICQPGAVRGLKLALQCFNRIAWRDKEVAVEPLEIAGDLLFSNDSFNAGNRRRMALCCQPRSLIAVILFKIVVAVIKRVHQMRSRSPGHPSANRSIIEYDHRPA